MRAKTEKIPDTEMYIVRKKRTDPTVFTINESLGLITISYWHSSWHSYWRRSGTGMDSLKSFLLGCDNHYLMKNFECEGRFFDADRTLKKLRKDLKAKKKEIDEYEYEKLEEKISNLEDCGQRDGGRYQEVVYASPFWGLVYQDPHEIPYYVMFSLELQLVFKHHWKPFMRLIKKEEEKRAKKIQSSSGQREHEQLRVEENNTNSQRQ